MEFKPGFKVFADTDVDSDLGTMGVVLDMPVMCSRCMVHMDHVGKHFFRCPRCGATYNKVVL